MNAQHRNANILRGKDEARKQWRLEGSFKNIYQKNTDEWLGFVRGVHQIGMENLQAIQAGH